MIIDKIIKKAHDAITRIKGKEYAPTSTEIQKQITMAQQDKQKQLLIEVMNEDAKDGLYEPTQTAVEWLWNVLVDKGYFKRLPISEIKQAKQMEKEQMRKCASFWRGKENEIEKPIFEQYYNETYNK